jgi:hypothetical protein
MKDYRFKIKGTRFIITDVGGGKDGKLISCPDYFYIKNYKLHFKQGKE